MTERKVFKFYKSYFDIFNELESDESKVQFIGALLNRQFYGTEPTLTGMAKFAYISQKHSIDKQVKGFEDKIGKLNSDPMPPPTQGCTIPPTIPPMVDPAAQLELELELQLKVELQLKREFETFWDLYDKKTSRDKCFKKWIALTDVDRQKIIDYIPQYKLSTPDKKFRKNPETFLNNKSWNDEIINTETNETIKPNITRSKVTFDNCKFH